MRCYNCYINLIKGYDEDGVECEFYRESGTVKADKRTSNNPITSELKF